MPSIPVTTTIPKEQWDMARKNGWKWSDLIISGIGLKMRPDQNASRMSEQEMAIDNLMKTVRHLRGRIIQLENKDLPEGEQQNVE